MRALHDPWGAEDALRGRVVLLAMSGGVDSSAAAVLLHERGALVVGLTMKNFCWSEAGAGERSCCSTSHLLDARRVCERLGIAHHVLDTTEAFGARVIRRFVDEYEAGRTPNPCIDCNQSVRFPLLLGKARELGAELVASGHYARLGSEAGGSSFVRRARDAAKDQSYFLHGVPERCLERTVFPLGDLRKEDVRRVARAAGLQVADKPESQEICFLPDGDRAAFLAERGRPEPGPLVDLQGNALGMHAGVGHFTVGQRHGLGVSVGRSLYVHRIEPGSRTVVLGDEPSLFCDGLEADAFWLRADPPYEGLEVQVRYRHAPVRIVRLDPAPERATLRFAQAQRAVAPGQAAVLYDGDAVVGGGRIVRTLPLSVPA